MKKSVVASLTESNIPQSYRIRTASSRVVKYSHEIKYLRDVNNLPAVGRLPTDGSLETGNEKAIDVEHGDLAPFASLYSVFTKAERLDIVSLVSYASFFLPLSNCIYYPALDAVADALDSSLSNMNLTIIT